MDQKDREALLLELFPQPASESVTSITVWKIQTDAANKVLDRFEEVSIFDRDGSVATYRLKGKSE